MASNVPPLLVIVGETGSGKSALAMEIARRFRSEIISADSWAIYKELDIGTAKPSKKERQEIPHHLIDFLDPTADYTAAEYKLDALHCIGDIASRGKLPIMVGGTGLYVDSVIFDFSFLPPGSKQGREVLNQKTIPELIALAEEEGIDLTGIDRRNKRRIIRALETGGAVPTRSALRRNTLVIGLQIPRNELRRRIEQRTTLMFKRGLKREVERLAAKYGWMQESMKGIGYREFQGYFNGQYSLNETKRKIIHSTLNTLAKHQRTWFKRNRHIHWVRNQQEAIGLVKEFIV